MGCFCWQHWKCFEDPDIRLGKYFLYKICNDLELNGLKLKEQQTFLNERLPDMKLENWNAIFNQTCAFRIRIHKKSWKRKQNTLYKILKIRICITANLKNISTFWFWYFMSNFLFKVILMGYYTNQKIIGLMVAWRNGRSLATCEKYRKVVLNWNKQY